MSTTTKELMQIEVLSPAKVIARVKAARLQVPSALGYLEILPMHTPLVAELGTGEMVLSGGEASGIPNHYFVAGGFVEVNDEKVTVLVDVIEKKEEIDVERAKRSKQRAEERLLSKEGEVNYARAQAALARAYGRLNFTGATPHTSTATAH